MRNFVVGLAAVAALATTAGAAPVPKDTAPPKPFAWRTGEAKDKLLIEGGGTAGSEAAVARGLAWLAKQQKANGSWEFDGTNKANTAAATGMALLPFLAAGQTPKAGDGQKYAAAVKQGLAFLTAQQKKDGSFSQNMYENAIAALAVIEAVGMTGDPALTAAAQKAVDFVQQAQGPDGSWGYGPGTNGDTSILGWQVQALHAAKLCPALKVDKGVLVKANQFLDTVAAGALKSNYGYRTPGASLTLTPVGLLCRYYEAGWGPEHPGLAAGIEWVLKARQPSKAQFDMYYYYYATQLLHFSEGEAWHKTWNPKMRDLLVGLQAAADKGATAGSWDPDAGSMGTHCGRLGTTCLSVLTLESYYRYPHMYKRGVSGLKELERVK